MSIILAIALQLVAAPQGHFDDRFAARVARGRLVETGPTGSAYQKALWSKLGSPMTSALKDCIARNAPADLSPFTLVADVRPDGRPSQVAVEPATPVANCVAGMFAVMTLHAPPPLAPPPLAQSVLYPIEIDVTIKP